MNNKSLITKPINMNRHKFDLEERTYKYATEILLFCKGIKIDYLIENQIRQVIKSATSIGANYAEANCCNSKKDFISKISICKKEAKETTYWIRILSILLPDNKEKLRELWKEAHELLLIFSAIIRK